MEIFLCFGIGTVKREIIYISCFPKIEDIFISVGSNHNGKHYCKKEIIFQLKQNCFTFVVIEAPCLYKKKMVLEAYNKKSNQLVGATQ